MANDIRLLRSIAIVIAISTMACGRFRDNASGDNDESNQQSQNAGLNDQFYAPSYLASEIPEGNFENEFTEGSNILAKIESITDQKIEQAVENGKITLPDDSVVSLTSISKNECPSEFTTCDIIDSEDLGISSNVMVDNSDVLKQTPLFQGDRGTCVSFALNAAVEIVLRRKGIEVALSEQNTYFLAKRATDSWNEAGLVPSEVLGPFTADNIKLVAEEYWPYNSVEESCSKYNSAYPGFTCSATEAQGGGSDFKEQEPKAEAASGYRVTEAHQLYASVGRVKQALHQGYPVILGVNANDDFNNAKRRTFGYVGWKFKKTSCGSDVCGHAIVAVGYQDDENIDGGGYVIIKNSWGRSWGYGGFAFVSYEWLQNSILDAQAIVEVEAIPN